MTLFFTGPSSAVLPTPLSRSLARIFLAGQSRENGHVCTVDGPQGSLDNAEVVSKTECNISNKNVQEGSRMQGFIPNT